MDAPPAPQKRSSSFIPDPRALPRSRRRGRSPRRPRGYVGRSRHPPPGVKQRRRPGRTYRRRAGARRARRDSADSWQAPPERPAERDARFRSRQREPPREGNDHHRRSGPRNRDLAAEPEALEDRERVGEEPPRTRRGIEPPPKLAIQRDDAARPRRHEPAGDGRGRHRRARFALVLVTAHGVLRRQFSGQSPGGERRRGYPPPPR